LFVWLVVWLVGWLVGWTDGSLDVWSDGRMVKLATSLLRACSKTSEIRNATECYSITLHSDEQVNISIVNVSHVN